jgi:sugar fermentation stimulation protein A
MDFPSPLIPAKLLKRYKRFLADVEFADGTVSVAHCANPGAMLGLAVPGARVWLAPSPNPKAKLAWRWELEEAAGGLVGINTSNPNQLVAEAISAGHIATLKGYERLHREVAYGVNSRVDLLLETGGRRCFVEVKNVHLKRGDRAEFPDCVTARGAKHLQELAAEVRAGHRAVMFFCIQRDDCAAFSIAADLDPGYARAFIAAREAGVEAVAYACDVRLDGIRVTRQLEIRS